MDNLQRDGKVELLFTTPPAKCSSWCLGAAGGVVGVKVRRFHWKSWEFTGKSRETLGEYGNVEEQIRKKVGRCGNNGKEPRV